MLKIYHAPRTRGIRVIWLCDELGIPLQVERIDFSAQWRARPEWRAISPVGKVPVLFDGDIKLLESCAMMDYILERYGNGALQPSKDPQARADFLHWHWFAEATFARPLGEIVNHAREFPGEAGIPEVVAEMKRRAGLAAEAVASHMQGREYLVEDQFTAADISMGYSLHVMEQLAPEYFPETLKPYWGRLSARPAFQRAIKA